MLVRKLDDLIGTEKEVRLTDGGSELQSVRILTRDDGCDFSVSDVKFKVFRTDWSRFVVDLRDANAVLGQG